LDVLKTVNDMPLVEENIRETLKQVVDPELFVNVVDLGLVYEVRTSEVDDKTNIEIDMTLTSPACPAGPQLVAQAKQVVGAMEGAGAVDVKLVMSPPWTPDRMTEDARDQLGIAGTASIDGGAARLAPLAKRGVNR
jgi:metal-sulfur cluster biosynthetic enzyme